MPGERRWINAVAMMTPEPKNLAVLSHVGEIRRERGDEGLLECGWWDVDQA